MAEKIAINFNMPLPLKAEFDRIAARHRPHEKWSVTGAAIVRLLELTEDEQDRYARLVRRADGGDEYPELISEAKARRIAGSISALLGLPEIAIHSQLSAVDRTSLVNLAAALLGAVRGRGAKNSDAKVDRALSLCTDLIGDFQIQDANHRHAMEVAEAAESKKKKAGSQ